MRKALFILLLSCWFVDASAIDLGQVFGMAKKAVSAVKPIEEPEEIDLGAGLVQTVLGAAPLVDDPALQRYVNHVGRWLADQSERPGLPWKFGVTADDTVNAFSMPGGYVLITRGLYQRLHSESELAGVLGHEIAHVVKKHHLTAIQNGRGKALAAEGAQMYADSKGGAGNPYAGKLATFVLNGILSPLDKNLEFEADRMGIVVAARGGYSPYGLVGVLQTLSEIHANDSAAGIMFRTHPSASDRLDQLAAVMGDKLDDLPAKVDDEPRFAQFKR